MPFDRNKKYKCVLCENHIEKESIKRRSKPLACKPCRDKAKALDTPEKREEIRKMLIELGF